MCSKIKIDSEPLILGCIQMKAKESPSPVVNWQTDTNFIFLSLAVKAVSMLCSYVLFSLDYLHRKNQNSKL